MKNLIAIPLILLTFFSCSDNDTKNQLLELESKLEQAKMELSKCSNELFELKNTPENRLIRANKFVSENKLNDAIAQFNEIEQKFQGTEYSKTASKERIKIEKRIAQIKIEEERKKALGFKILKPTTTVKYDNLTLKFQKIWKAKRWTFDDYGSQYFLMDAERGNSHLMARVSITSESNNPSLPPIFVYQMINGELKYQDILQYKFRRWEDYGSYLGNYADYGNDFSHSKTIPFNCGVEINNDYLNKGTVYIVLKKQGCFNRTNSDYGNPEIYYKQNECTPKSSLKINDFDTDYILLKKM